LSTNNNYLGLGTKAAGLERFVVAGRATKELVADNYDGTTVAATKTSGGEKAH